VNKVILRGSDPVRRGHRFDRYQDSAGGKNARPGASAPVSPKPTAVVVSCAALGDGGRKNVGKARCSIEYQPMVAKYCIGCHSARNPLPAGAPLALDKANFTDPGADAATWGTCGEEARCGRDAAAGIADARRRGTRQVPLVSDRESRHCGREEERSRTIVLHRLNRTEYANAVRDLLGVTLDVGDLLPSDSGEFGFDNIATALPTSPLLLERYLTAGLRIAELAVGDATSEPGTYTYTISTVVTQNQHVEGLPLGTRGGMLVRHTFPADGEYVFSGRLAQDRGRRDWSVSRATRRRISSSSPIDGKRVFSAPIGGKTITRRRREQAGAA
jgi:hypothetical protein